MSFNIYLVEDEEKLNTVIKIYLEKEGWHVRSFLTGSEARKHINENPDLWILDILLPDLNGYELLGEIRKQNNDTPVIFISALNTDYDRVLGLEMGSDDYLAKPFSPRELTVRSRKILERTYLKQSYGESAVHNMQSYIIDERKRIVTLGEHEIELTSKEFDLLLLFSKHPGQAFSREQIIYHVWGESYYGSTRVVDDLIRRVRRKMVKFKVETIYGYGYRVVNE